MKIHKNLFSPEKLKAKKYFSIFAFGLPLLAMAQTTPTSTENYTYTKTYLSEDGTKKSETVQYFDGLGRPKQIIQVKATPSQQDLVVPVTYDTRGWQTKTILPVPVPSANLGIQNVSEATANSYYGVANAYAEQKVESSPLARVLETAKPGSQWAMGSGHTRTLSYEVNKNADQVKKYVITSSWSNNTLSFTLPIVQSYGERQLTKNVATDEDGNKSIQFTNSQGQVILARKMEGTTPVDTYYIYNTYGQLALVIPPKANEKIAQNNNAVTQEILDQLCYQYRYDNKGRQVEKRLPGKNFWDYLVYDRQNRLVLSQNANQHQKQWSFVKYDQQGRTVYTGLFASTSDRTTLQNTVNNLTTLNNEARTTGSWVANGQNIYYTNTAFPTANLTILAISYYDDYAPGAPVRPAAIFGKATLGAVPADFTSGGLATSRSTKGMPTSSYIKNIEDDSWTQTHLWYDTEARSVGSHTINHLGGYTRTETELDFAGVVQQTKVYHKRLSTDTEKLITQHFEYDSQNRLKKQWHKIDNLPDELLSENTYNELSQLTNKKVGASVIPATGGISSPLQSIDYTYNILGTVTKVNNPANLGTQLFGYELKFTNPENTANTTGKYNGNIAEVDWKTASDQVLRRYDYQYDSLDRLKKGIYSEPGASVPQNDFYNETVGYDLNGNIASLQRSGNGYTGSAQVIDNLSYTYTGNRLQSVTDDSGNYSGYPDVSGNTITYDDNGNMKDHLDKGILNIEYNFLNLPAYVKFDKTYVPRMLSLGDYNVNTRYLYRADGTKLKKTYTYGTGKANTEASTMTEYLDGFQYEYTDTGDPLADAVKLKFVPTAEGYYNFENNKYIYSYTDHLGNVRLSYTKSSNGSAAVLEENNYYPFGLKHQGYNLTNGNPAYKYQYNGKELQQETGWNDYGARMYMSDIGRWGVIDPLAEQARRFSPYHYGNNNPIRFTDPDGMQSWDNLSTYNPGSSVASFLQRSGVDDDYLPRLYVDNSGMMIINTALGNDGKGGGGATALNIILNFLRGDKENLGNFVDADFEKNGWHIIDATSLADALEKLTTYLGNNLADNIYINAHGLVSERYVYDEKGQLIPDTTSSGRYGYKVTGDTGFYAGNDKVLGGDIQQYISNLNKVAADRKSSIESFIGISKYVKEGKNLIIGACWSVRYDDLFGTGISSIVKSRDVFVNRDYSSLWPNSQGTIRFQDFIGFNQTSKKNYENGWVWYRDGKATQTNFNIIMTKYGVKTIK